MSLVATRMDLEGSHVKGNQPVSGRQAHMMSFLDKFLKDKIKKIKNKKEMQRKYFTAQRETEFKHKQRAPHNKSSTNKEFGSWG